MIILKDLKILLLFGWIECSRLQKREKKETKSHPKKAFIRKMSTNEKKEE